MNPWYLEPNPRKLVNVSHCIKSMSTTSLIFAVDSILWSSYRVMFPCMISISHFLSHLYGLQSETLLFIKNGKPTFSLFCHAIFLANLALNMTIYLVKKIHDIEDIYDLPSALYLVLGVTWSIFGSIDYHTPGSQSRMSRIIFRHVMTHMVVSWNRPIPSHHPFFFGIFHEINQPFFWYHHLSSLIIINHH